MKKKPSKFNFERIKGFTVKLKEVSIAVFPLVAVLLLLSILNPLEKTNLIAFVLGALLIIIGQVFFFIGVDKSFSPIGELMGGSITKLKKLPFIALAVFVFGIICTVAEPDMAILSANVAEITDAFSKTTLILAVSVGVGVFLLIAVLKVFLKWNIKLVLFLSYTLVFALAVACRFLIPEFIPLAFDSGGVATGPILIPFILAIGLGIASSARNEKGDEAAGKFGFAAFVAVGPIVAILILALFYSGTEISSVNNAQPPTGAFISVFGDQLWRVAVALVPILAVFLIFDFFFIKLPKRRLYRILGGMAVTYLGLVLFLTGVNYGFSFAGYHIGYSYVIKGFEWAIFPISFVFGFLVAFTEPSIRVLGDQVETVTSKRISKKVLLISLSIAIAIASILAMVRLYFKIDLLWFMGGGYFLIMILMIFCPEIFTAIAFDSGSVASGCIAASFMLPFAMGVCGGLNELYGGYSVLEGAFGLVAFITMIPLIVIQILGIIFKLKQNKEKGKRAAAFEIKKDYTGLEEDV